MHKRDRRRLLERCVDVKKQKSVSLTRLARELGIAPLTSQDTVDIVENKKHDG